jgi:hypothetical protein
MESAVARPATVEKSRVTSSGYVGAGPDFDQFVVMAFQHVTELLDRSLERVA